MSIKDKTVIPNKYHFFWGGNYSQWVPAEFSFHDVDFNTAEQFMMLGKAIVSEDYETANKIMKSDDPSVQKKLGRSVKNFDESKWDLYKYEIVLLGNFLKSTQVNEYAELVPMDSDVDLFVEASPYDKVWGIKMGVSDPDHTDPKKWKGENLLGYVITDIRDLLVFGSVDSNLDDISIMRKLDTWSEVMRKGIDNWVHYNIMNPTDI